MGNLFAQSEQLQVVVTDVKVNAISSPPQSYRADNTLEVQTSDKIFVSFATSSLPDDGVVKFDVSFNGVKKFFRDSKEGVDSVQLSDMPEGLNVLVVKPSDAFGNEYPSLIMYLKAKKTDTTASDSDELAFTPLTIVALGISVLFIVITIVLSVKLSGKKLEVSSTKAEEKEDYKYLYERLKIEQDNVKRINNMLSEKMQSMQATIVELEKGNNDLIQQKEKLVARKVQLEALQQQKEEYFAMAIHDIKNPAGTIRGLVELIKDYDLTATEQHEIIESLINSSEHIFNLAQKISAVMSQEQDVNSYQLTISSLKQAVDDVVAINSPYARRKGIKLLNKSSNATPEVMMDFDKVKEVIDNLVNNAIKFCPTGANIMVRTYFNEKSVMFEVSDSGPGIPEEDKKKLFYKGAKLSNKPTGGEQSTGLGLWIVKKVIDDHKGQIWVESKIGVGTKFAFSLPLINDASASSKN